MDIQAAIQSNAAAEIAGDETPAEKTAPGGRLRIAVVAPALLEGRGTERATTELVTRLAVEHEVCLFLRDGEPPSGARVCLHRLAKMAGPGLLKFLSFYWSATRAISAAARRHGGFDVVYSPGPNCRQADVVTAHFCQARQLEILRSGEHCPAAATLNERARRANRRLYADIVSRQERRFYSLERRTVLTPSLLLARDLEEYYGLAPEQAVVLPLGVDPEEFNPERRIALRGKARGQLNAGPDSFVFLFIGNNWLIKGLLYVLRALAEVPDVRLAVVGTDVEPAESWKREAERLRISSRVVFLPRRTDIIYYYAAADALVAPSVYDTFGLMPLEVSACGLPSIITRTMGVAELFSPEEAVVLDCANDVPALAAAMRRLATDSALRQRLAAKALARAKQQSWEQTCRGTLNVLQQAALRRSTQESAK